MFFIAVSAAIDSITEAISFSGFLLTYGHAIVGGKLMSFVKNSHLEQQDPLTSRVAYNQYNHNQAPDFDYHIIAASDYD